MTEAWNLYREKKPYILALVINIIMFLMEPDGKSLQLCKTKWIVLGQETQSLIDAKFDIYVYD
jgi:hypothetical protein